MLDHEGTAQPWPKGREFDPLFQRSMMETMTIGTDQMPNGRKKLTHAQGAVAKIRFIPQNTDQHNLSGLFRTGADYGLIRYSDVFNPNVSNPKTLAGAALKFFRDGIHSGNTVLMTSFNSEPSHNFLKEDFCSIVEKPLNRCSMETIQPKLAVVDILAFGNSSLDLAEHHADSSLRSYYGFDPIVQPFKIRMQQELNLRHQFPDSFVMEANEQILSLQIKPGSRIAKVWCTVEPWDTKEVYCGDLVTTSEFITSVVADQKLFFTHQVMKEDCEMRPEWEDYLPKWDGRIEDDISQMPVSDLKQAMYEEIYSTQATQDDWTCPFKYLFDY